MNHTLTPLFVGGLLALACSGGDETPQQQTGAGTGGSGVAGQPSTGSGGRGTTGGTGGTAGTGGTSGSATTMGSGGQGVAGVAGMSTTAGGSGGMAGTAGMPGGGRPGVEFGGFGGAGAPSAGGPGAGAGGSSGGTTAGGGGSAGAAAGAPSGGMGGTAGLGAAGGSSVASYTCNQVIGIDSTSEWFTGGFENQVDNAKWQIIYYHPGYVEDWANANDMVYTVAPTSPCAMNSDNPDRVIFNMFQDTADTAFANKNSWVTGLTQAITNLKNKYSRLKRVDLLTMTRAPNNVACDSNNKPGSMVEQFVDDAVTMVVGASTGMPQVVASPPFFAESCTIFQDGGPHFTTAGKPIAAKIYGDYYSAEK